MKMKHIFISMIMLTAFSASAQTKTRSIYKVQFYKVINDGSISHRSVSIDGSGVVKGKDGKTVANFDATAFAEAVNNFVTEQNVKKVPANNDDLPTIDVPKPGKHSIYITVWFRADFLRDSDYENKTHYVWNGMQDNEDEDYPLFKYLDDLEVAVLKAYLK